MGRSITVTCFICCKGISPGIASAMSQSPASSAAICWLIAVWVMKLFCAPRVMLPVCATARKYANRSNFKGAPLLPAG